MPFVHSLSSCLFDHCCPEFSFVPELLTLGGPRDLAHLFLSQRVDDLFPYLEVQVIDFIVKFFDLLDSDDEEDSAESESSLSGSSFRLPLRDFLERRDFLLPDTVSGSSSSPPGWPGGPGFVPLAAGAAGGCTVVGAKGAETVDAILMSKSLKTP